MVMHLLSGKRFWRLEEPLVFTQANVTAGNSLQTGCAGVSGSGAICTGGCANHSLTGEGGTGGRSGGSNSNNDTCSAAQSEADYRKCLTLARHHHLFAGEGGRGQIT